MKLYILIVTGFLIACSGENSEGYSKIIGHWKVESATEKIPKKCNIFFIFKNGGYALGGDGYLNGKFKYTISTRGKGYVLNIKYYSMKGDKNCQGLAKEYVKNNSVLTMYLEFINSRLFMYMGPNKGRSYFVLTRK